MLIHGIGENSKEGTGNESAATLNQHREIDLEELVCTAIPDFRI